MAWNSRPEVKYGGKSNDRIHFLCYITIELIDYLEIGCGYVLSGCDIDRSVTLTIKLFGFIARL